MKDIQNKNLLKILKTLPHEQGIISTPEDKYFISKLVHNSFRLREKLSPNNKQRILISELSIINLIKALVILDGIADALFILPNSISKTEKEKLIKKVGCTHQIDNELEISPIDKVENNITIKDDKTKWIMATSGTTGTPKIVVHTLNTLIDKLKKNPEKGKEYTWGLMYSPYGFAGMQVLLQSLISGSNLCTVDLSSDISSQIDTLSKNEVNALSATPTLWRKMLFSHKIKNLSLRQITLGGEIADQRLINALVKLFFSANIIHIYASTEAGVGFSIKDRLEGFPLSWLNNDKIPFKLRINKEGCLCIMPRLLPDGEEIKSRTDKDGYLNTGDVVEARNGRVIFLGRSSGAINVGGNKVHPEYIENIIRKTEEVQNVIVKGKKSSIMGQIVEATILTELNVDKKILKKKILANCQSNLKKWQTPGIITFTDSLKENYNGKIKR